MSTVPENLRYTESHEWVGKQDDGTVRQLFEESKDGGKSWNVIFDGTYTRRGE